MATIDLSLDALKIPALDNFTPDFGTMITETQANKGGLSTFEVNRNMMMPWAYMRPKVVVEDSVTTVVEYDAKVVFNAPQGVTPSAGYTLTMGDGTYIGCTVTYTNLMEYACTVKQSDGTTTLFSVPAGKTMSAMWTGTAWRWTTTGSVTADDPTPPSSAAVHAATVSVDLSSEITGKHAIVDSVALWRTGNVLCLFVQLIGTANLPDGDSIMQLPIGPKFTIAQNFLISNTGARVMTVVPDGHVRIWWNDGTAQGYNARVCFAFSC